MSNAVRGRVDGRTTWALWTLALAVSASAVGCGGATKPEEKQAADLDAQTLTRKAESFMQAGRTTDALKFVDQALALEPKNAVIHHAKGTMLYRAGRFEDCVGSFQRALELDPYMTDAENFLGSVYTQLEQYGEAEEHLNRVLADPAYPTPELAYFNLSVLYSLQGRDDEALLQLRRAVEINPRYYQAHFELASTLDRLGKLEEAAREYEVAAPGYKQSGDYHYRLGFAYFRLGDKYKSREALRRAIDVSPGSRSAALADELLRVIQ